VKQTITLLIGLLLSSSAFAADPIYKIDPPAEWTDSEETAKSIAVYMGSETRFGGLANRAHVRAFVKPRVGSLVITQVEAEAKSDDNPGAIRITFDALRKAPSAASSNPADIAEISYKENISDNLAESRLEWQHNGNETTTLTRALVYVDNAGLLRSVTAECIVNDDAHRPECEKTLASLDITLDKASRGKLGSIPASRAPAVGDNGDSSAPAEQSGQKPGAVLYAGDGEQSRSYWLYIIIGAILVMGALFFGLRRRSAEKEDQA
jgi:hypothetical protein